MNVYDLKEFAPAFFKIADKEGQIIPFRFNRAQQYVHQKLEEQRLSLGYVRALILKGRQQGISTYIQARFFHKVLTVPGTQAFILTHMGDATRSMFEMTRRYNDNLPPGLAPKPDEDSSKRLTFSKLNSGYRVGTAGSKQGGRSMTNQLMHLSEYAFYENPSDIKKGIEQTVADLPGTEKIKESTANGTANVFYLDWQDALKGESDWQVIFVPWYWQDEYTRDDKGLVLTDDEQDWMTLYGLDGLTKRHLAWRRNKLADFDGDIDQKAKGFSQEYPFTAEEAFLNSITDPFISVESVQRARKEEIDSDSSLVIGVDPARMGVDKTGIIRRRGRKAYNLQLYSKITTMELCAILKDIITKERPTKVFIDCIGLGAGVVDRMHEMGYECVIGVNVARSANDKDKFANLRAELWSEMRDWLNQDMPVQIPDDPELQKEMCGLGYSWKRSSGCLLIESKEDAKERGMTSPDRADCLALTFAYGQHAGNSIYMPQSAPARFNDLFS